MNTEALEELYAWCVEKRVLHVQFDGVTVTLHPDALPPIPMERAQNDDDAKWDDADPVTPQEKARLAYAREQNIDREVLPP